jgi:hypothetical protein
MVNGDDRYDTTIAEITATVRYLGLLSHKGERERQLLHLLYS